MMRAPLLHAGRQLVAALAISSLTSICQARPDDDPVGSWKLCCTCPDGKARDCVINVSRNGQALVASYQADGVTRAARRVVFDKGVLSVQVDGEFAGSRYQLTYTGKPAGNSYCGDVRWSYLWASGTFGFKGERIEDMDVAAR